MAGDPVQVLVVVGKAACLLSAQPVLQAIHFPEQFTTFRGGQFRSGSGRRRAQVGGEIGDGEIGLVANAANDRFGTAGNCSGHTFFVEGPKVFDAAAAPAENQFPT